MPPAFSTPLMSLKGRKAQYKIWIGAERKVIVPLGGARNAGVVTFFSKHVSDNLIMEMRGPIAVFGILSQCSDLLPGADGLAAVQTNQRRPA